MRKTVATFGLLFLGVLTATAQKSTPCEDFKELSFGSEFAFSAYSLREIPTSVYSRSLRRNKSFARGFDNSVANGLMYKLHFGGNALRLGGSYMTVLDNSRDEIGNISRENTGIYHGADFRLGLQHTFLSFKKKWYVIGAVDGYLLSGKTTGNTRDIETADNQIYLVETSYTEYSKEKGAALSVGLYYKVKRDFSISLEMTGNYSYLHTVDNLDYNSYGWVFRYHPVRMLSLNYHF